MLLAALGVPIVAGLFCLVARRLAGWIAVAGAALTLLLALAIYFNSGALVPGLDLQYNFLGSALFVLAALLTLLVGGFSIVYMAERPRLNEYYSYLIMSLGLAAGLFFAANFILLIFFWGGLGVLLYLLIGIDTERGAEAAKKALLLVGGSDALMLCGLGLLSALTVTPLIGAVKVQLTGWVAVLSFLFLLVGIMAKTGVVPLHFWVPAAAESTPATVMAFLPASLDKLVGIYLLARLCLDVYVLVPNSPLSIALMLIGSVTILFGVMAALVQHNMKKLLSFHAVSQAGYMIVGIGSGVPLAMAGGIFHLINNALYKNLLFLVAGSVEKQTGSDDLRKLGGLAKTMPWTFAFALIAALSISGVPPFNGFASKWLIYLGLLDLGNWGFAWLAVAMFGSALTLASFVKILHAVFLTPGTGEGSEVHWSLLVPMGAIAALCVLFGILSWPLKYLVLPAVPGLAIHGQWNSEGAALLIFGGLVLGLVFYWLGGVGRTVAKPPYIGGEVLPEASTRVTGVEFYNTIKETEGVKEVYRLSERFSLYDLTVGSIKWLSALVRGWHNGFVQNYAAWLLFGFAFTALILFR
ncbi:MAG: proton-conducting transporter membrane subunit [Candidatus Margulisiibacteriota bacterium]|jgi:formate hydrogenlyase subunit 3/multisubunit Na+/H+ antiporter MnhD subunit